MTIPWFRSREWGRHRWRLRSLRCCTRRHCRMMYKDVTRYHSFVWTLFYSVVLMFIANLHFLRMRVPLFHCKTKTHFEDTWRVDEIPDTNKEGFGTCRKTKKTLSQKRRKERKSKLRREGRYEGGVLDSRGLLLKRCSEFSKKITLIHQAGRTKNCALFQKEGTTKRRLWVQARAERKKKTLIQKKGGRTETHPDSTDGAVCKKDAFA